MNKVLISGNLGAEPRVINTTTGNAMCSFIIAVTDGFGDKAVTQWHGVNCWGKVAENCIKYLVKGSRVLIDGKLNRQKYKDKNGNEKESVTISAFSVEFLNKMQKQDAVQDISDIPMPENVLPDFSDEDIPF